MNRLFLALPLAAALSACGSADEPPTDLETARSDGEAQALARNIEAGDFLDLALGPKIAGPQGEEVESALSNAEGNFADMRSFVACPLQWQCAIRRPRRRGPSIPMSTSYSPARTMKRAPAAAKPTIRPMSNVQRPSA